MFYQHLNCNGARVMYFMLESLILFVRFYNIFKFNLINILVCLSYCLYNRLYNCFKIGNLRKYDSNLKLKFVVKNIFRNEE